MAGVLVEAKHFDEQVLGFELCHLMSAIVCLLHSLLQ